jgi:hypothetical protein
MWMNVELIYTQEKGPKFVVLKPGLDVVTKGKKLLPYQELNPNKHFNE